MSNSENQLGKPNPVTIWNAGTEPIAGIINPGTSQPVNISFETANNLAFQYAIQSIATTTTVTPASGNNPATVFTGVTLTQQKLDSNSAVILVTAGPNTTINNLTISWIAIGN